MQLKTKRLETQRKPTSSKTANYPKQNQNQNQKQNEIETLYPYGSQVEVSSDEEGFKGAWFLATVLKPPPQLLLRLSSDGDDNERNNNKIYIEYNNLLAEENGSTLLTEFVDVKFVRPKPPVDDVNEVRYKVNDVVDAYYQDGWWCGVVTEVVEPNSKYRIFFSNPPDELLFRSSDLRIHRSWIHGNWVIPQNQQRMRESDFSPGTAVEVNIDPEFSRDVWFPATFVKRLSDNSFLVLYKSSNGAELQKAAVNAYHIRPIPPILSKQSYSLLEKVDVFCDCRWLSGIVTKILADGRYIVYFKRTKKEKELSHSELRLHMDWTNGKWIHSLQDTSTTPDMDKRSGFTNGGFKEKSCAPAEPGVMRGNVGQGRMSAVTLKSFENNSKASESEKIDFERIMPSNKRTKQISISGDIISLRISRSSMEETASEEPLPLETSEPQAKQTEVLDCGIADDRDASTPDDQEKSRLKQMEDSSHSSQPSDSTHIKGDYEKIPVRRKRGRPRKLQAVMADFQAAAVNQLPSATDLLKPVTESDSVKPISVSGTVKSASISDFVKSPSIRALVGPPSISDSVRQPSISEWVRPASTSNLVRPPFTSSTAKPPAISDSGMKSRTITDFVKPAAIIDSAKPDAIIDSVKPPAISDLVKPPAIRDSVKPSVISDSVKPSAISDSAKPFGPIVVGLTYNGKMIDSLPGASEQLSKMEMKAICEEGKQLAISVDHGSIESEPQKKGEVTNLKRKRGRPPKVLFQLDSPKSEQSVSESVEGLGKERQNGIDLELPTERPPENEVEKPAVDVEPPTISESTPSSDSSSRLVNMISNQFKQMSVLRRSGSRTTAKRQVRKHRKIAITGVMEPANAFILRGKKLKSINLAELPSEDAGDEPRGRVLEDSDNGIGTDVDKVVAVTSSTASDDDKPLSAWLEGAHSPLAMVESMLEKDETGERRADNETPPADQLRDNVQKRIDNSAADSSQCNDNPIRQVEIPTVSSAIVESKLQNDETCEIRADNETPPAGQLRDNIQERIDRPAADSNMCNDNPIRQVEILTQSSATVPTANQDLPFVKNSLVWSMIESMEVFQRIPQNPHFRPLYDRKEECREGLAIGSMVTFTGLVEKISKACFDDANTILDGYLDALVELEEFGFNVTPLRDLLNKLLSLKGKHEQAQHTSNEIESQIKEQNKEKSLINDKIADLEKKISELMEKQALAVSEKERKDAEINLLQTNMDAVKDTIQTAREEFEKATASL